MAPWRHPGVFTVALSLLVAIAASSDVVSVRGEWHGMGPLVWRIESRHGLFLLKYEANTTTNIMQARILIRDGMYIGQGSYEISAFGMYNATSRTAVLVDPFSATRRSNAISEIDSRTATTLQRHMYHLKIDLSPDYCRYIVRFTTSADSMKGSFVSRNCYASIRFTANAANFRNQRVKSLRYAIFFTALCVVQTVATLCQMRGKWSADRANTISLATLFMLLIIVLYATAIHLGLALANRSHIVWYTVAAASASVCSFTFVSWILTVWGARCSDRHAAQVLAEKAAFFLMLSGIFGLFLYTAPLFTDFSSAAAVGIFSFFLPQIMAKSKTAFHPAFIVITAVVYVAVPAYLWGCPKNFFAFFPRPVTAVILGVWVAAQAITLIVQYSRQIRSAHYTTLASTYT